VRLDFFPSRQIGWYMARLFLVRTFAVLLMLVLILQTLDLLGESGKILGVPGNSDADLWRYIGYRVPQLVQRFLPFSVLLGTLITFTALSQNSEVVAMKAAGLSAHQILAPMILASLFVAGISFAFNDGVVAPASAKLKKWQDVEYGPLPKDNGVRNNVWVREGRDLIQARTVIGKGDATRLEDVRIYQRVNGSLTQVIRAEKAGFAGGAWKLEKVRIFDVGAAEQKRLDSLVIGRGIEPKRFDQKKVDGDALAFIPLSKAVDEMKAAGRRTDALEGNLWHKIAGPLSSVLMPLLGAVAAFGLARSGALFLRAVIGMALGFAYFVADNFALAMGNLGAYPPFVAAWAPFLLFLLIGETVLVRTEE
jgi:lipopolysaccharide export system permease protein